jgi:hypothetical protein
VPPLAFKFLDALKNAIAGQDGRDISGHRSVSRDAWRAEAVALGLINPEENPKSARSLFDNNRRTLIAANLVASNEKDAWLV